MRALGTSALLSTSYFSERENKLIVETTLYFLSYVFVWSAKMQLKDCYTQKSKQSLNIAVLQAIALKTITVPQAKLLVQLGISYQTLQDICCTSFTNANFEKVLSGRSMKPIPPREVCGPNPNLRSRAFVLKPHLLLYLYFCYQLAFLKAISYPKKSQVCQWAISVGNHKSL